MTCTQCNGYGYVWANGEKKVCNKCGGNGQILQTNEEWFCTLSTEEKARFLTRIYFDRFINSVLGKNDLVNRLLGLRCYDKAKAEKYITDWLKEVHRESE